MTYDVAIVPSGQPGQTIMQANVETWRAIREAMRGDATWPPVDQVFGALGMPPAGSVVRLTFDDATARRVMAIAGIAG